MTRKLSLFSLVVLLAAVPATASEADLDRVLALYELLADRLPFDLEDGQHLRCWGRLSIYEVQGRFQLTAERALDDGVEALALAAASGTVKVLLRP